MKKLLLFLNLILFTAGVSFAQTPQYSTQTTPSLALSTSAPFRSHPTDNKVQLLYLASEFPGLPNNVYISKIYFKGMSAATNATYTDFEVKIGQTTATTFTSTTFVTTGMVTALQTPLHVIPSVVGNTWFEIALTTPILIENTKNLIIEVSHVGFANGFDLRAGSAASRRIRGDVPNTTGTRDDFKPDFGFDILRPCNNITNLNATNITRDSAYISWNSPGANASAYEFELNQNPNNPGLTAGFQTTTNTFIQYSNLTPGTCYYIHIRTNCDPATSIEDTAGWVTHKFCTLPECETPTVTISNVTGTTAIARWDGVPGAYGYEYSVGTEPTPPAGAGAHTTYTSVKLWGLTPNKTLYFYLRAKCTPIPLSAWGTTPFHTTIGTGVDDISGQNGLLEVYPNPVSDVLNIRLHTQPVEGSVIYLTDVTGRVVKQMAVNKDTLEVNMSNLPAGLYLLKYSNNEHSEVIKVTKQ